MEWSKLLLELFQESIHQPLLIIHTFFNFLNKLYKIYLCPFSMNYSWIIALINYIKFAFIHFQWIISMKNMLGYLFRTLLYVKISLIPQNQSIIVSTFNFHSVISETKWLQYREKRMGGDVWGTHPNIAIYSIGQNLSLKKKKMCKN